MMTNTQPENTDTEPERLPGAAQEVIDEHETPAEPDSQNETGDGGREAAKYRHKLRATEGERDTLRARLDAFTRAEVERLAARTLPKPGLLWAAGANMEDFVNDDGTVNADAVHARAVTVGAEFGVTAPRLGYVPTEGERPLYQPTGDFTSAFAPKPPE